MNMYAYVGNDPVNQIDPSGVEGCPSGSASSGAFRCGGGISEQEEDAGTNRLLLRVGQLLVYDAILHPLTSSEARSLPVQFASYAEERIVNFGPSHAATRELASSLYVRQFTDHITQQFAKSNGGFISNGTSFVESESTKFRSFGFGDAVLGAFNGINIGDVVGSFTDYVRVSASDNMLTFTATNVMGLRSFYGGNRFGTNVQGPPSGAFSDFSQVFTWQVNTPDQYRR